jgi:hypothetical protein
VTYWLTAGDTNPNPESEMSLPNWNLKNIGFVDMMIQNVLHIYPPAKISQWNVLYKSKNPRWLELVIKITWVAEYVVVFVCMYINTVVKSLYLWHDFHNIIFKIKHELYTVAGSAPAPSIPLPPHRPRRKKILDVAPAVRKPNTITVIIFSPHPKSTQPFETSGNCVYHQFQHSNFVYYAHNVHYVFTGLSELKVSVP